MLRFTLLIAGLLFLCGCDASRQENLAERNIAEPKPPVWLLPPNDEAVAQYVDPYKKAIHSFESGEQQALLPLIGISQELGINLLEANEDGQGSLFLIQSGQALRYALHMGASGVPKEVMGTVFYNEACMQSKRGKLAEAEQALQAAVESGGFLDFALLEEDEDLVSLRATAGFPENLAAWKATGEMAMRSSVEADMRVSPSFPFVLAAEDIAGNRRDLQDWKGDVVIVDVWGTWCPPCRAEIPSFVKLQDTFGEQGLHVLGLNYERTGSSEKDRDLVTRFVADNGINYPCVLGDDATRDQIPNFQGFPTTIFIDKAGKVRLKIVGQHDYAYLAAAAQLLLDEEL